MSYLQDNSPAAIVARHQQDQRALLDWFVATYTKLGRDIWANPHATPQQLLEAYGPQAAEMFRVSALTGKFHFDVKGQAINPVPPGYEYTINEDGTVTITAEPPAPEPEPEEANEPNPEVES